MKFNGFEHLTANYLYCPNQFFDVCLAHHSRGTVRLVAYILRKTLGWLDEEGNPVEQDIAVSYRDLITEAGISRGAIRKALDEAVAGGLITCVRQGKANGNQQTAETAQYALHWDADSHYAKEANQFKGFFAGEGNRTPIPNSFFDLIVRQETLAVVKVVGAVLRHTVGYQNQFGGRRQAAPLSYSYIQKYVNLSDRSTLSAAIRHSIETGFICCVQQGSFHPDSNKRRAATYTIRWHGQTNNQGHGSKTRPVIQQQYKNQTSDSSITQPAVRFKNQTEEMPQENNTDKQQNDPPVAAVDNLESFNLLRQAGFDEDVALELSGSRGLQEIKQQIEWLLHRNPDRNSLGMLRKAIKSSWSKPESICITEKKRQRLQQDQTKATEAEVDDARVLKAKREKKHRREQLLPFWSGLSSDKQKEIEQTAFDELNSDFLRDRFKKNEEFRLNQCLDTFANQQQDVSTSNNNETG